MNAITKIRLTKTPSQFANIDCSNCLCYNNINTPFKQGGIYVKGAKIINLCEVIEKEKHDAFKWAVSELLRMGLPVESINLIDVTFMRCDYPETGGIKYILVKNYDHLKRRYPIALEYYVRNGTKIYRFFDGKHGGITHLSSKKYHFA